MSLIQGPQKLGKLYFRFIAHTELEKKGITANQVATSLEKWGLIRVETDHFFYLSKFNTEDTKKRLIDELLNGPENNSGPKKLLRHLPWVSKLILGGIMKTALILFTLTGNCFAQMSGLLYLNKVWVEQPIQREHEVRLERTRQMNMRGPANAYGYPQTSQPTCYQVQDVWIDGTPRLKTVCQ